MGMLIPLLVTVLVLFVASLTVEAFQFSVAHKYAHLEGSPVNSDGRSVTPEYFERLLEHHRQRRRLIAAVDFPLGGSGDVTGTNAVGLYYTRIMLGTPPAQYYVAMDTGSDVLWVDCAPCTGCPPSTTIPGVTVNPYNPTLSSTDTALACSSAYCAAASNAAAPSCDANNDCSFQILYGDGSNVTGYIISDAFTFDQSPGTTATANIHFGCGTTLGGFAHTQGAVGGLMGFGQAAVSVPSQLASQGLAANEFAHCLQGDSQIGSGGFFIIANITEPNLVFTPQITGQGHYNVGMQNIAVNGVNITTSVTFDIVPGSNQGVIMDSGTTLATLSEPAFTSFLAAITSATPVAAIMAPDGTSCWPFSGDISTAFPSVTLYFDGGVMNLTPYNYLYPVTDTSGAQYQCMGWQTGTLPGSSSSITIWGDIVLKDQLIVYDNVNQQIGWKPFNCSMPVLFSS